jgi:hypothetical protein
MPNKDAIQLLNTTKTIKSTLVINPLFIYVMITTNKWLLISKSCDDLNWCTPYRGTWSTYHIHPTLDPRIATFCVIVNRVGQILCSQETSASDATPGSAEYFVGLAPFLSSTSQWSRRGNANHPLRTRYIGLLGPQFQHVISTFNTCSWELTHRSLTNTGGGYNLGGVGFSHHSPRPSQPTVLGFPLRAPPSLKLTKPT